MNTTNTLGIVPKLLPVTGTTLLPLSLIASVLSLNVVRVRVQTSTYYGRQTASSKVTDPSDQSTATQDPMLLATTMHTNFLENAPLAIVMASVVELNGGDRKALGIAMVGFVASRLAHAYGIGKGVMWGRTSGYFGSLGIMTGLGVWAAYLVRGYWVL